MAGDQTFLSPSTSKPPAFPSTNDGTSSSTTSTFPFSAFKINCLLSSSIALNSLSATLHLNPNATTPIGKPTISHINKIGKA
jgi:hypothetical protein